VAGGEEYSALELLLQQEKKLRAETEQKLGVMKGSLEAMKKEEDALKSDIMDYERKIAKANLEIDKVCAVRLLRLYRVYNIDCRV